MSTNVFLAPCDPGNFDRTVRSPVDLSEYPEHPSEVSGMDTVRFWGVRNGSDNETYFEKMESGDLVLFYQDGAYVGTGRIGTTFEDEAGWASSTFWNDAPSTRIYTLKEFEQVSVPKSAVNVIFDYVADFNPQGLMRVADNRVTKSLASIKLAVERFSERTS
ncbi:hypothetical protein [Halorarum salinum]|uniref:EVE domain-containing protein n=1 Tax=Halorarum salinum TaxID=2743089 RepID=A0A7D5LAK1_9EURY|nr:hypothetical protein [Halobaculum salinum]QLG61910.1 hypothetical protein HUG12_09330 [Halobaculum salinum]